jgi:hypothetical protein
MTYFTPLVSVVSDNRNIKRTVSAGPRPETLMIIHQFARLYHFDPEQRRRLSKPMLN